MHNKGKGIAQTIGLTAGLLLSPYKIRADPPASYRRSTITIESTSAIASMVPYPYLHLLKGPTPTTDALSMYRYITLEPSVTFNAKVPLPIKKRFMPLPPYFSTASVTHKRIEGGSTAIPSDPTTPTKDLFPITVDVSLGEGPLLTITHHNAWGDGHNLSHQLFLKRRWGYGLTYELPKSDGNYFLGGQYYTQIDNSYTFKYKNLWIGKLFAIQTKAPCAPYYWITGLSGYKKHFIKPISTIDHTAYHNEQFVLGKIGWVADGYVTIRNVYRLHGLERLPKGGSIEILYGYQDVEANHRHYIGIHCIKNIANPTLKYLHFMCESGAFIHKKVFKTIILKLALAYAGPPIQTCNGARQFIAIDYIIGCRMPRERMLGIRGHDPESLETPDNDNRMQAPIHAQLNVHLDSTLHMPIMIYPIRFVVLGFAYFIALYNRNNMLLNQTWVDSYGTGLQLEHITMPWPAVALKIGYSPLLGKIVPSVELAKGHFKNKTDPKPKTVAYS